MRIKKNKGFTLIELVVVIVLLGILSVTAAPKYLNLTSDAYRASLDAMAGAVNSANEMVYAKAIINNVETLPEVDGSELDVSYAGSTIIHGKMQSDDVTMKMFVPSLESTNDWTIIKNGDVNMRIHPAGHPTIEGEGNCYIQYSHQWSRQVGDFTYPAKIAYYTDDC